MKGFILFLFALVNVYGLQSIKIEKGVTFQLTGQNFLLDSLVMKDSSTLLLDNHHSSNIIRANVMIIGKHCSVKGVGKDGLKGPDGIDGDARSSSTKGTKGRLGFSGISLILNFSALSILDTLLFDLHGGKGGEGGKGGSIESLAGNNVFGISKSTSQYSATEQPHQGIGGNGGDGGDGGTITLSHNESFTTMVIALFKINNEGGEGGISGTPTDLRVPPWYFANERNGNKGKKGAVKLISLK